ncbi:fimbrial protein [Serratia sp. JSRIV004]|uniref:fimbrial protein n=1 Tax=unclassified Serratia (in: enterobacteria) TaxID=2647522 RepID=UPI001CBE5C17|nr:fimbrial protein [Serratia sp. JSRIV004]
MKVIQFMLSGLLILLVSSPSQAVDSTITISGNVQDNACAVAVGSQDFTVDLMKSSANQFNAVRTVTPKVPFSIELTACGSSTTAVKVGFTGTADTIDNSLLRLNSNAGAASGIGVQILDGNSNTVLLNADQSTLYWQPLKANQNNTLNYYARLMATRLPVVAGVVDATGIFTLEFQ